MPTAWNYQAVIVDAVRVASRAICWWMAAINALLRDANNGLQQEILLDMSYVVLINSLRDGLFPSRLTCAIL